MSNTILRQVSFQGDEGKKLLHGINKSCDIIEVQLLSRSKCSFETVGGLPNITADGHDVLEQL
jgi:hypothetical protein